MAWRNLAITSPHTHGEDVKLLQHAIKRLSGPSHYDLPRYTGDHFEDGVFGGATLAGAREVGYYLGAPDLQLHGPVRPHLQQIIRATWRRTPNEFRRGHDRYVHRRVQLKHSRGPDVALAWCKTQAGVTEHPFGSNRGGPVKRRKDGIYEGGPSAYQKNFGTDGAPWCGAFNGTALLVGGVRVDSSILWTPNLHRMFEVVTWAKRRPGDLLELFGEEHQEMVDHDTDWSWGGNTSPGSEGSQNNGGCVAHKSRSRSDVDYVVRPPWH